MKKLLPVFLAIGCGGGGFQSAAEKYERANRLYANGEFGEAAPLYEYVTDHREELQDAHLKLALCHENLGQIARGIRVLERFLRAVHPRNPTAHRILAEWKSSHSRADSEAYPRFSHTSSDGPWHTADGFGTYSRVGGSTWSRSTTYRCSAVQACSD